MPLNQTRSLAAAPEDRAPVAQDLAAAPEDLASAPDRASVAHDLAAAAEDDAAITSHHAILVASDDQPLVAAISTSLRASGFDICTPSQLDGSEAASQLDVLQAAAPPSLIVLDSALSPERRANALHACRSHASAPIVALAPRAKVRQTAAEAGVWVCLAKPVELTTLLTAITRITRHTATAA